MVLAEQYYEIMRLVHFWAFQKTFAGQKPSEVHEMHGPSTALSTTSCRSTRRVGALPPESTSGKWTTHTTTPPPSGQRTGAPALHYFVQKTQLFVTVFPLRLRDRTTTKVCCVPPAGRAELLASQTVSKRSS